MRFPYHQLPSLVLAFNDEEIKELNVLYQRGLANGVPAEALKIIDRKEIIEREPLVNPSVKQALLCTTSIVIDPCKGYFSISGGQQRRMVLKFWETQKWLISREGKRVILKYKLTINVIYQRNLLLMLPATKPI